MTNKVENINIDDFLNAISSMLESKYILIDRKISDILLSVARTKPVYNAIAKSMINYDFKQAWKNSVQPNFIKLPEKDDDRVAFIFCLLNNIDDKNLDITMVLDKYFSYDLEIKPYELFCKNIIVEFRTLILKQLGLFNESDEELSQETKNVDEFVILQTMLNDFAQYLLIKKKWKHVFIEKDKFVSIIYTFEQAAKEHKKDYFESFVLIIESAIVKNKELKEKFESIKNLVINIIGG